MTWWLEAGEDGSDRIDLMAGGYLVLANGFDIVEDQEYPDQYQQLFIPLSIQGTSANDLFNKRRAILTKLRQAEQGRQPAAGAPWVNIAIQFGDADTLVRWYIVSGSLTRGSLNSIPSHTLGAMEEPALLQLRVLKGGLGEAIEYGPFTVTGDDLTFHIDGVPGDEPALAEFRITDNSTNGAVVNRLRWACRSLPDMDAGDYEAVLPFNETDESEPDTFTGGIETISASSTWQTIGSVSKAASIYNGGLFDAWARVRDAATPLAAPSLNRVTVAPGPFIIQKVDDAFASGDNPSLDFPQQTQNGSTLVMFLGRPDGDADYTPPSGWLSMLDVGSNPALRVFYYPDAPPHTSTGEFVKSASHTARAAAFEVVGVTATPLDRTATDTSSSTTSHPTGTTATTQQAHELLLAFYVGGAGVSSSIGGDWDSEIVTNATHVASQIVNATGTYSGTFTSSGSTSSATGIATLRASESAPPDLGAGDYRFWVTALDGSIESAASLPLEATVITPSAVQLQWSQLGLGTPTGYRVYWQKDIDAIVYVDTGSTDTSFTLSSETSDGTADPPLTPLVPSQFRVRIGPESGTTHDLVSGPLYATVANSEWEPLYLGRTYLGPAETPLVATPSGWKLDVQGRADTSTQMDVDALVLLPADEQQMDVRYAPGDLDTNRTWVVGTTPDMRSYGFLRDGSANEAGRLLAVGRALLGPGDTTCVVIPTVSGGVWNVSDVSLSITVFVRPRYSWLAGGA